MAIPQHGWKSMDFAPKDGKLFIAYYHEFNRPDGINRMQPVWWMVRSDGSSPGWKKFGSMDTAAYCESWMWPWELMELMATPNLSEENLLEQKYDL